MSRQRRTAEPKRDPKTGRWFFRADVGVGPDGKRRQTTRRGFRTRAEAQAVLDNLRTKVRTGSHVTAHRLKVADFLLDEWLPQEHRRIRASTHESYTRHLRTHVIPAIGGVRLQALNGGHLNALYDALLTHGRKDGRGGLSPRTVRYIHTIIHAALKDAVKWRRVARNAADEADPPSAKAAKARAKTIRETQTWSSAELRKFLELVRNDRHATSWLFLATTGARRGECLGLRWSDLNLDAETASIRQEVIHVGDEVRIESTTKTDTPRTIELDRTTVTALRAWRKTQAEERLALGVGYADLGLVFCRPDGQPLHPKRYSREFSRRIERYGLRPIRLHDLRHTWATLALEAGVPPKIVSERLGHASTAITIDLYTHVVKGMQSDAAETVAGLIFRPGTDVTNS